MFVIHFFFFFFFECNSAKQEFTLCFFKKSDCLYFFPANGLLLIVLFQTFQKIPTGKSTVKFSVKLQATNMGLDNSFRLNFPQIFGTQKCFPEVIYKSSCSALNNAVIKYLNFCGIGSKLGNFDAGLLKITLRWSNFSKNLTISAEQQY